ncbi:MAG: tetratricopeptide repeat protein [Candidatus Cloacimonetes bacterium]|nr:tetratricopeptide repeat protein [Candidatus Cloacimonadota bacterium]
MKKSLLLLVLTALVMVGCVSNRTFRVEKDKIQTLMSKQGEQETELEVLRKDILAQKERISELLLELEADKIALYESELPLIYDELASLNDRATNLVAMQDELSRKVKEGSEAYAANALEIAELNKEHTELKLQVKSRSEEYADNASDIDRLREELELYRADTDFVLNAFTETLVDLKNQPEPEPQVMSIDEPMLISVDHGDLDKEIEKLWNELETYREDTDFVLDAFMDMLAELKENSGDAAQQEYMTGALDSISSRLGNIDMEIENLRDDLSESLSVVRNERETELVTIARDINSLRYRVDEMWGEVAEPLADLSDVISQERAKKEKKRQQDIATQYKAALTLYNKNRYEESILKFEEFLHQFPNENLSANAYYWIGENYYGAKEWSVAAFYFQQVKNMFPEHPKAADASMKLAMCQYNMDDIYAAHVELLQLKEDHPNYRRMDLINKYLRLSE